MSQIQIIRERSVEEGVSYDLCFDWSDGHGGFAFPCDQTGHVDVASLCDAAQDNYHKCASGQMRDGYGHGTGAPYVRPMPWRHVTPAAARCDACGGEATMSRCGAWVCDTCENHVGLARCFCGWSASGGNGYEELLEMGETPESIDGEDY